MNKISDWFAMSMTKFFRFVADTFFAKRYGHRAVVLETVAGVPGMVAGMWMHLTSLRQMKTGYGPMIRELLAEAENERMHLMFFIEITKPNVYTFGLVISMKNIRCILSFSASARSSLIIGPYPVFICLRLVRCIHIPATMPGTPATVSRTTARCPYLFAKNVSATKRKNFVIDIANQSDILFILMHFNECLCIYNH